jgi:hypothetical protein
VSLPATMSSVFRQRENAIPSRAFESIRRGIVKLTFVRENEPPSGYPVTLRQPHFSIGPRPKCKLELSPHGASLSTCELCCAVLYKGLHKGLTIAALIGRFPATLRRSEDGPRPSHFEAGGAAPLLRDRKFADSSVEEDGFEL